MQTIQNQTYITLQEYAQSIGKKDDAIKQRVKRKGSSYKQIQSTYQSTEKGRIVLYQLDSLHPEHQKLVKAYLGISPSPLAPKGGIRTEGGEKLGSDAPPLGDGGFGNKNIKAL